MPPQPDLLQPALRVQPSGGASGPRLWVRRLAIWRDPGGEILRDISLRPGLNIIWSPDGADADTTSPRDGPMGHGSGKTLFCRLLRYCLGEDRFAPEDQRQLIGTVLLNGLVGAEVMLDGRCWAIVRPLGIRRRHMAVPEKSLDEVAAGEGTSTGLDPFLDAVEQAILTADLDQLVPGHRHERRSWPIALAWLMRDQECRFDHVLDWRSAASDSDSPARGLNQTEKLDALRAFLQAITPDEQSNRAEAARLDEKRRELEQELGHQRWEIDRARTRLAQALALTEDARDRVVVGVTVRRDEANPDIAVRRPLNPTAGEDPVSVAVDHQRQHHPWVILRRARAAMVHLEGAQIDTLHNLDHEVPKIIRREPVPKIGRKQKRLVPITLDEVAHAAILRHIQPKVRQTASHLNLKFVA